MPAAVVKGIILSISIITALGIAVLENPQVQVWLEEQRRKIAELLRSLGEELDPESRRAAEAFAYEGRTPATDDGLRREVTGSKEAAAIATGRSLSGSPGAVRRIPVRGPSDPDEAEERRRKGREYLAQRNQQMYELQQRRKAAKADGLATPPSPTSFDDMVNEDGKLREREGDVRALPSPPIAEPIPEHVGKEMREVERQLAQPLLAGESSSSSISAFQLGSQLADPFGDEYALDRSETPRPPPVPPKINLEDLEMRDVPPMPESSTPQQERHQFERAEDSHEELSYEEQLAIALSLSEAESSATTATVRQRQPEEDDDDLRAAIQASLKDMDDQQAAHAIAHAEPVTPQKLAQQPLVDLTPPSPSIAPSPQRPQGRSDWEALFGHHDLPSHDPLALNERAASEATDELYSVTPELTRARLASLDAQQSSTPASIPSAQHDPVREATQTLSPQPAIEASFYSAPSSVSPPPPSTTTLDHEAPQLVDLDEVPSRDDGARTPTTFGFHTDSDSDTFASLSRPASQAQSRPRSETSNDVEVVDVVEDSDVDMLSEEGDGIATPDSWTEVGSRDGESEMDDEEQRRPLASL